MVRGPPGRTSAAAEGRDRWCPLPAGQSRSRRRRAASGEARSREVRRGVFGDDDIERARAVDVLDAVKFDVGGGRGTGDERDRSALGGGGRERGDGVGT